MPEEGCLKEMPEGGCLKGDVCRGVPADECRKGVPVRGKDGIYVTQRQKSNQIDMLHGPLLKKILLFALPLAATSLLQQLFNTADQAIVGRFAGSDALAAVGSNSSLITLMINLFVALGAGGGIVIAEGSVPEIEKNKNSRIVMGDLYDSSGKIVTR